jgi:hypothetical protein
LKREGRSHSLWTNPSTGAVEAVPRHTEISDVLVRKICGGFRCPRSAGEPPRPVGAEQRLHGFLEGYYGAPARVIMARQASYAGPIEGCVEWLQRWINAGARHISLRFAGGDQLAQVNEAASRLLPRLKLG